MKCNMEDHKVARIVDAHKKAWQKVNERSEDTSGIARKIY